MPLPRRPLLSNLRYPRAWHFACAVSSLARGPQRIVVAGDEFVAFRAASGQVAVLHARCVHMGADLSRGRVRGDCLQCPFHEWEFDLNGRCVRIPACKEIPGFASQTAFPTRVRGGYVFFCRQPNPPFEAPFFENKTPEALHPARPFVLEIGMPWYMAGANGFDFQHFRAAHDRRLIDEPVVDSPSPFARRVRATFEVTGEGWRDRLTRRFSGPEVTMTITSWCGTIILVTAQFRRTTSYGMVCISPIGERRSRLHTIVWIDKSSSAIGRAVIDPLDASVRRSFIREFMRSDQDRSDGIDYTPATLTCADAVLGDYFVWLQGAVGERTTFVSGGT